MTPTRTRCAMITCAATVAWSLGLGASTRASNLTPGNGGQTPAAQHDAGAHVHAEAAKLVNPVKSTPASIAAGKKLYESQCVSCHGTSGTGDGKMAAKMTPKPSNLADASWKHGSSDGEIYTLVKDGSKNTPMKGFASKMTAQEMWSVVNYLKTLKASK
jgi:mono/diheme cytochrome c family protein